MFKKQPAITSIKSLTALLLCLASIELCAHSGLALSPEVGELTAGEESLQDEIARNDLNFEETSPDEIAGEEAQAEKPLPSDQKVVASPNDTLTEVITSDEPSEGAVVKKPEAQSYNNTEQFGEADLKGGSYNFAIPLSLPGGVNGHTPSVSLAYNSSSKGTDYLGAGWNLRAIDCVERGGALPQSPSGEVLFFKSGPTFTASDTFYLSGERLVLCDQGAGGASLACPSGSYRKAENDFARIAQDTSANKWIVTSKSGTVREYAQARGSSTFSQTTAWCLSRVVQHGNEINYDYTTLQAQGSPNEYLLDSITWGGALGASPLWRVLFSWEDRADVSNSRLRHGLLERRSKRLSNVQALTTGGLQVANYHISYDYSPVSGRSRVSNIVESGTSSNDGQKTHSFTYREAGPGEIGYATFDNENSGPGADVPPLEMPFVDLNVVSNSSGDISWDPYGARSTETQMADLNGDGRTDLIRHSFPGLESELGFSATRVFLGGHGTWTRSTEWEAKLSAIPYTQDLSFYGTGGQPYEPCVRDRGVRIADLNGDGYADFIRVDNTPGTVWGWSTQYESAVHLYDPVSNQYISVDPTPWVGNPLNPNFSFTIDHPNLKGPTSFGTFKCNYQLSAGTELVDVNGDSLPDVVISRAGTPARYAVFINSGHGFTSDPAWAANIPPLVSNHAETNGTLTWAWNQSEDFGYRFADINGDGLVDLVGASRKRTLDCGASFDQPWLPEVIPGRPWVKNYEVYLNTGYGWQHSESLTQSLSTVATDFFFIDTAANTVGCNPAAVQPKYERPTYTNYFRGATLVDVNHDGLADLVRKDYHTYGDHKEYVFMNNGNGWNADSSSWHFPAGNETTGLPQQMIGFSQQGDPTDLGLRSIDWDGDGMTDFIQNSQRYAGFDDDNRSTRRNLLPFDYDLLHSVTTPTGGSFIINYQLIKRSADHPRLTAAQVAVSSIQSDNGMNPINPAHWSSTTSYHFRDGYIDLKSNAFLGFGVASIEHPSLTQGADKLFETSFFNLDPVQYCRNGQLIQTVKSSKLCNGGDGLSGSACLYSTTMAAQPITTGLISTLGIEQLEQNLWVGSCTQGGVGPYFSPPESTLSITMDPSSPGQSLGRRTTFAYDNFGNQLANFEFDGVSPGTYYRAKISEYLAANITNWIVDRPTRISYLSANQAQPVKSTEYYYDGHASLNTPVTAGLLTREVSSAINSASSEVLRTYTNAGNPKTLRDPNGRTTTYHWDSNFPEVLLRAEVNAKAQTTSYSYDNYGRLDFITDANGVKEHFTYDDLNRLLETYTGDIPGASDLPHQSVSYLDIGSPNTQLVITGRLLKNNIWTYQENFFDGLGRSYMVRAPHQAPCPITAKSFTYNVRRLLSKETLPYCATAYDISRPGTTHEYDNLGRTTADIVPGGYRSDYFFGIRSDPAQKPYSWKLVRTDRGDRLLEKHLLYDAFGRLVKVGENFYPFPANPGDPVTTYVYDTGDNLVKICMADGAGDCSSALTSKTLNFFDGFNRLTAIKDGDTSNCADPAPENSASGCPVRREYDLAGNMVRETDAKRALGNSDGALGVNYYDELNRKIIVLIYTDNRNPETHSPQFIYNYTFDNQSGACPFTQRNLVGRLSSQTLTRESTPEPETYECYSYDAAGRMTDKHIKTTPPGEPTKSATINFAYNNLGLVRQTTMPSAAGSRTTVYAYNNDGSVGSLSSNGSYIVSNVQYDEQGRQTNVTLGNGVRVEHTYRIGNSALPEGDRRLQSIKTLRADSQRLMFLSYGYDKSGNITSIQDSVQGGLGYAYDGLNRLREFKKNNIVQEAFEYDVLGNRTMHRWLLNASSNPDVSPIISLSKGESSTNKTLGGDKALSPSKSRTRYMSFGQSFSGTAGAHALESVSDQVVSSKAGALRDFSYDANGNLLRDDNRESAKVMQYTYWHDNKLRGVNTTASAVSYYYDAAHRKIASIDNGTLRYYFDTSLEYGKNAYTYKFKLNGKIVATLDDGSGLSYKITDHLGSVRLVLDQQARQKNVFVYKPFGEVTSLVGNLSDERHRFNGNQQDSAGILDYDARSYTPGLGIFLQPDSMVPDYENPQALNRYSYVFNNPLNLTDPTGHAPAKEGDQHRNSSGDIQYARPQGSDNSAAKSSDGLGVDIPVPPGAPSASENFVESSTSTYENSGVPFTSQQGASADNAGYSTDYSAAVGSERAQTAVRVYSKALVTVPFASAGKHFYQAGMSARTPGPLSSQAKASIVGHTVKGGMGLYTATKMMQNPSRTNMFMLGLNFALEILMQYGKTDEKTPPTAAKPKSSGASSAGTSGDSGGSGSGTDTGCKPGSGCDDPTDDSREQLEDRASVDAP